MSTKIYDALIIEKPLDWVFDFLHKFRPQVQNTILEGLYESASEMVCNIVDRRAFGKGLFLQYELIDSMEPYKNTEYSLLKFAMISLIKYGQLSYNSLQRLQDNCDYNANCIIMKYSENVTVVKFFIENSNAKKLIMDALIECGAHDFHYQDSTDKPTDISSKDWKNRMHFWEKMGKFGTFKDMGFSFELGLKEHTFSFPSKEAYKTLSDKILEYTKDSKPRRILEMAYDEFPRYYKETILKEPLELLNNDEEIFLRVSEFNKIKKIAEKTEEGKIIFEKFIEERIKPYIVDITENHLLEEYILTDKNTFEKIIN